MSALSMGLTFWPAACLLTVPLDGLAGVSPLEEGGAGSGGSSNCKSGWQDCNNDKECDTDTTGDPKNCGSCGHACIDGGCAEGKCQRVELGKGTNLIALAQLPDEDFVYWLSKGAATVTKHGKAPVGAPEDLAGSVNQPIAIALDTQRVYWATGFGTISSIPKLKKTGDVPTSLQSQQAPVALAVDPNNIYWVNAKTDGSPGKPGEVRKAPSAGGTLSPLATDKASPIGIAVSGSEVFWISYPIPPEPATIMKVAISGGMPIEFATGLIEPDSLAADATHVYVAEAGTQPAGWNDGVISRFAKSDPTKTKEVLASGLNNPRSIALSPDSNAVYWSASNAGLVMGMTLQPLGKPAPVESSTAPKSLSVDKKCVYWIAEDKLWKVAR